MPNFRPLSPIGNSQRDNYTNFNLGWDADDDVDDDLVIPIALMFFIEKQTS